MVTKTSKRRIATDAPPLQTCAEVAARNREAFPVGAVVQLKSGGFRMTVVASSVDVEVMWAGNHGLFEYECVHGECLMLALPEDEIPF